jgi:diguanylate cyclase (GGDEF)-like protein
MPKRPAPISKMFQIIILSVIYAGLPVLQFILPKEATGIMGIISQFQFVISVYMVVSFGKPGFRTAVALNIAQFLMVTVALILIGHNDKALPGSVIPLTTILIASIISKSHIHLNKRNEENMKQRAVLEEQAIALKNMAYYDTLTNFMNLNPFLLKVNEACASARNMDKSVVLAFIDLDNFKHINDTMGHAVGDAVLKTVSSRLIKAIHPEDIMGRIGGDEFALLISRDIPEDEMIRYLLRLMAEMKNVRLRKDVYADINASIGIAFFPKHASGADDLLHCADVAMYKAKNSGKARITLFEPFMRDEMEQIIKIEQNLLSAIDNNEFHIHYQPQYRIENHQIIGLEALIRWTSKELGNIGPNLFIPIAEQCGLIHQLGYWVLRESCMQFMLIKDSLPDKACLSVNISPVQLANHDFINVVGYILKETDMPAHALMMEITESAFISDTGFHVLNEIRDIGIKLALDDFGKGYSSLHYLQDMPIDTLKIDKDYISNICIREKDRMLVLAMINISHNMGYRVIAEGVETQEQLALLKEMNCDCMQGYLWGKPMPVKAWLNTEQTGVSL